MKSALNTTRTSGISQPSLLSPSISSGRTLTIPMSSRVRRARTMRAMEAWMGVCW